VTAAVVEPSVKQPISRIGIGTVQFGMPYGIKNTTGQVPYRDVVAIFESAHAAGIDFIDTARAYGESEAVIAAALDETGLRDRFTICTKLDLPPSIDGLSRDELLGATRSSIDGSRKALRSDRLDVVLLHRPQYRTVGDGAVWEYLLELLAKSIIGRIGVSAAFGPGDLEPFYGDGVTSMMQIPFNALDGRWSAAHVFERAAEHGVTVVNRSTFLQGLLLMSTEEIAARLPSALEVHSRWTDFCAQAGIEPKQLAFAYVLAKPGIDCTIVGVDSKEQFEENLVHLASSRLSGELIELIGTIFARTPEEIVNPSLWPAPPGR
jgi:aryl-alcohol dehydrogenase-like predicted oxidoreductase